MGGGGLSVAAYTPVSSASRAIVSSSSEAGMPLSRASSWSLSYIVFAKAGTVAASRAWSSSPVSVCANSANAAALRESDASMNRWTESRLIRRCDPGLSNSRKPSQHSFTTVGRLTWSISAARPVIRNGSTLWMATS